jgi:hypothetical protein
MGRLPTTVEAASAQLLFTTQIYVDFSSYSDIAIGLGLLLPAAGSDHAEALKALVARIPVIAQYVNPQIDRVHERLAGRRHDPAVTDPATRKTHDDRVTQPAPGAYVSPPPTVLALDRVWNPGPLAAAHQSWAQDCKVCHSAPFTRVVSMFAIFARCVRARSC